MKRTQLWGFFVCLFAFLVPTSVQPVNKGLASFDCFEPPRKLLYKGTERKSSIKEGIIGEKEDAFYHYSP
jgi:hypothetical protein